MQASPSYSLDCCTTCTEPQTVNVPGPAGGLTDCGGCGIYIKDTVEDLRQVEDDGSLLYAVVFGNQSPGDGQTRAYRWNPEEDQPDDGSSVIRPASQTAGALGAWDEL